MTKKSAILLLNVGSPASPQVKDVRQYLRRFLYDPHVIDIPALPRWFLVNCIIAPFRAPKSAKLYKHLWTQNGAPLVYYAYQVQNKLQNELNNQADVFIGMSYGDPLIQKTLKAIKKAGYSKLIVLPMFPQYASSSSGAAIDAVTSEVNKWDISPDVQIIPQFYNHPAFIKAFVQHIKNYNPQTYNHIIFSYHGLPMSHLKKMCTSNDINNCDCEISTPTDTNNACYKAACYETTRLIASELNLNNNVYSVGFQSRLNQKWILPFTDKLITSHARRGNKKLLIIAPSFVADCLETTIEIGFEYKKLFQQAGGQQLQLVESLNDSPEWIQALKEIILPYF